ncbi:Cu(I)-responsive transcriptional regulator [Flaviflagellibacter deserti]|jgi:MerR family transcriptional regulator, copper efflux regulator|uniref:Cu(I)-responsive transcriptional regulator n=1 Tax=Flaviflagellibacter deserti TaxID=2267266 RepID=A0ABV9Z2R8_9HYPH
MNIAEAARRAGLTPKAIRFYEAQGLLRPNRAANGYRAFGDADVHTLRFLKRARDLGFSVEECRALLALYHETDRSSAEVKKLAENRVAEIDRRLADLASIRSALAHLAETCSGEDRPECPILEDLASDADQDEERKRTHNPMRHSSAA